METTKGQRQRPSTGCDFNLALLYERREYFGINYSKGSFYVQESNGDLTRDHYLSSPPIEQCSKDFCTPENPNGFGWVRTHDLEITRQSTMPFSYRSRPHITYYAHH